MDASPEGTAPTQVLHSVAGGDGGGVSAGRSAGLHSTSPQ